MTQSFQKWLEFLIATESCRKTKQVTFTKFYLGFDFEKTYYSAILLIFLFISFMLTLSLLEFFASKKGTVSSENDMYS